MSDPRTDLLEAAAQVTADILTGNYVAAIQSAAKLGALLEVVAVPPIEPHSLDPQDRAEVDAQVDAEVSKT